MLPSHQKEILPDFFLQISEKDLVSSQAEKPSGTSLTRKRLYMLYVSPFHTHFNFFSPHTWKTVGFSLERITSSVDLLQYELILQFLCFFVQNFFGIYRESAQQKGISRNQSTVRLLNHFIFSFLSWNRDWIPRELEWKLEKVDLCLYYLHILAQWDWDALAMTSVLFLYKT